jgi:hypothetical protein
MTRYGSLHNQIDGNASSPLVPTVGMGATKISWTDRHPYTIIEVRSKSTIIVQEDESIRLDGNAMSEGQTYEYKPDPNGSKYTLTLRRDGRWKVKGDTTVFALGYRSRYHDFSF